MEEILLVTLEPEVRTERSCDIEGGTEEHDPTSVRHQPPPWEIQRKIRSYNRNNEIATMVVELFQEGG